MSPGEILRRSARGQRSAAEPGMGQALSGEEGVTTAAQTHIHRANSKLITALRPRACLDCAFPALCPGPP